MAFRLRPNTVLALWLMYWCGLFVATHVPIPEAAPKIRNADKVAHFIAYFGLAALGHWRLASRNLTISIRTLWGWAAVYALYGVADELLQPLVGRSRSFWDWLADAAGVALATLAAHWFLRKKLSEQRGAA